MVVSRSLLKEREHIRIQLTSSTIMIDADMKYRPGSSPKQTLGLDDYLPFHNTSLIDVLVVGRKTGKHAFRIHAELLIQKSHFFTLLQPALRSHFASGKQMEVRLPYESIVDFSAFARWAYDPDDFTHQDYFHHANA